MDTPSVLNLRDPPRFDKEPLLWFWRRRTHHLRVAFPALNDLLDKHPPLFRSSAFGAVFGKISDPSSPDGDLKSHFFGVDPLDWGFHLTEPQATKGLRHFLMPRDVEIATKRRQAFLIALGIPADQASVEMCRNARVEAEHPVRSKNSNLRIDLLIEFSRDAAREPVIVEAKFGHKITRGQLPAYKRYSDSKERRGGTPEGFVTGSLIVLGVTDQDRSTKLLKRNKSWRFVSWAALLLRFDRVLPCDADDDDFRRFRRTLWRRCGGLRLKEKR